MKNNEAYSFLIKYKLLLLALLLLFVTTVQLQVNYNKNRMHDYHEDEYYTISSTLPQFTPDKTTHRALNGPRMFTYLFYPGAIIGMINHMGGNIYRDGWKYPGHNYFLKNYKTGGEVKYNMEDPNFRYFHYYLKLQAIVFMFLTLIPIVFLLWKRKYFVAMFMVSTLVGINFLALQERSLFYIEPLLLSMMNILIWLYFFVAKKKQISWLWIIFSAFLFALTISLKFSALFIITLVCILLISKFKTLEERILASSLLLILSLFFFCLINWNIFYSKEVFNLAVHDYFSNFYQYATGNNWEVKENFKLLNLKRMTSKIFSSLGGLIFLFPIILFFGLKWTPRKLILAWLGFIGIVLLSIVLIAKQQVYIDRNILPFLSALILIIGVMLDRIVKRIMIIDSKKKLKPAYLYILIALLIFLPIWGHSKNYLNTVYPKAKDNIVHVIEGIIEKENRRLVTIDYPNENISADFASKIELPSAILTNGKNFKSFAQNSIAEFRNNDVVIVSEVRNNKQLTAYLLPRIFNSNIQFDKHFVFFNEPKKNREFQKMREGFNSKNTISLLKDSLAIREDLILREIRMEKGNKIYFKFDFLATNYNDWYGCRLYFHGKAYEDEREKLPTDRIKYGFEGWDFTVTGNNTIKYGNSFYVIQEFKPSLISYEEFSFGIFRGCTKSKEFKVKNVALPQ